MNGFTMNGFSRTLASLSAAAAFVLLNSLPCAAKPPNIVLILADDLGFTDLGSYGSEIETPNIDRLAAEGVRFSNYHTAASCAPTRGMLLTGVDSHRNGVPNIVEAIPASQQVHDNYRGSLGRNVVTVAERLLDAGYHTYMTGKWHLGYEPANLLPSARGFERTIAMADTGADNWEDKPYLPIYERANWFGDGERIELPDDFYSSKFFVDKTIEFIDSNRADDQPFFSYIPFQAVHIPVQAPREFTEKYLGQYDEGWTALRKQRLAGAINAGLVPKDTQLAQVSSTQDWDKLSAEAKRHASKSMAVYAGMVDAMDHHIGRLIAYLETIGEYDNTIFIFTSDNGAEGSDSTAIRGGAYVFDLALSFMGYNTDYETLGEKGSFVTIGPSFASAAASPLSYYKFFAHDGGMRVPLIVANETIAERGTTTNAFAYVTDLAPTILEMAGIIGSESEYDGHAVEPIVGTSLVPLFDGRTGSVHSPDEAIGFELAGNAALFKGDLKIVKDRGPIGDGQWHLFNIVKDPGEASDLRALMPERFGEMRADYDSYVRDNGVLPVADDYDQREEVFRKGLKKRLGRTPLVAVGIVVAVLGLLLLQRRRRKTV
ncbi:MAG: arylsulfatase A-like enzyme [Hyphomicrobiaceae bacterium]|jgi:arylsulfatase A-like enzyme